MRGTRPHWLEFAALIVLIIFSGVTEFTALPATERESGDTPDLVEPVSGGGVRMALNELHEIVRDTLTPDKPYRPR